MRRSFFTVGILACMLAIVTAQWSKEDQEIFRLKEEVEKSEGPGVTFYEFLECSKSASQDEINKAYRKRSRVLHPDKVKQKFITDKATGKDKPKDKNKKPGVHVSKGPSKKEIKAAAKAASDRFARLGIVANILRGPGRERYDHFLANGFPKWKGTGYYYARYRPGLGTVLTFLFIAVGGAGHWYALYLTWGRDQKFMQKYIDFARSKAWGDNLNIPGLDAAAPPPVVAEEDPNQPSNRRQRRMMEKDAKKDKSEKKTKGIKAAKASPAGTPPIGATGPKKRVVAENGKVLVVDQVGNVYLEQADEDGVNHEFLLDPKVVPCPGVKDTALYRIPVWAIRSISNRVLKRSTAEVEYEGEEETEDRPSSSSGADDFEVLEKVKTTAQNGNGKVIKRKKSARGR